MDLALLFFVVGLPFIIWSSVLLGQYPIKKIDCPIGAIGYILNSTSNSCTIELQSKIVVIDETCDDKKGTIGFYTNCNGDDAIPQYSLVPIVNDASEWRNHSTVWWFFGIACFFTLTPAIMGLIVMWCFRCWKSKENQENQENQENK